MTGGAVQQSRILKWLTSIITSYTKPLISSVAPTKIVYNHTTHNIAKADSGATFHFFKPAHRKDMTDIVELKNGPKATLPNDQMIKLYKLHAKAIYPLRKYHDTHQKHLFTQN